MALLSWIIMATLLGSIGAIAGTSFMLLCLKGKNRMLISPFVSYATGTLLGAAFLGMIPKALTLSSTPLVSAIMLFGILLFFLLEKLVIWRHCHDDNCEIHARAGTLIVVGDAFHNFVDGVVIAVAFMTDISFGVATAIAVFAHEIPQEMGDFAILLESGYTSRKAFLYNFFSQVTSLPGAVIAYFFLKTAQAAIPYVLAISASSFIYIALADLIPGLHRNPNVRVGITQFVLILLGIGTIAFFVLHKG
jgi:zinc and cadmium transporter